MNLPLDVLIKNLSFVGVTQRLRDFSLLVSPMLSVFLLKIRQVQNRGQNLEIFLRRRRPKIEFEGIRP